MKNLNTRTTTNTANSIRSFDASLVKAEVINNNGDIKNIFNGFNLHATIYDDKIGIKNTRSFLWLNKEQIDLDCTDYQTSLFYIFYTQAYNCFDYLAVEYKGQKNKLDILENWLRKTIERITTLRAENKMQNILLFSKQQIDIYVNDREIKRGTKQEYNEEKMKYASTKGKTILDKINIEYQIRFIIDKIGIDNYNYLVNYYSKNELQADEIKTKTAKEKQKKYNAVKKLQECMYAIA